MLPGDLTAADARARLRAPLAGWLPRQRWFAGKARTVDDVRVDDAAAVAPGVLDVFAVVRYSDGGQERYQVPLAAVADEAAGRAARVADVDGVTLVDGATDERACRALAGLTVRGPGPTTAAGATLAGSAVTGRAPSGGDEARPLRGEQSNTSVVFGRSQILKLYRRLETGVNPEVELTAALTRAGFPHVPAQHGALRLSAPDGPDTALALLSDFVDGDDAWALALAEVDAARRPRGREGPSPDRLTGALPGLGGAVARLHLALGRSFGAEPVTPADLLTWRDDMRRQVDAVLDLAARRAPRVARAVLARAPQLVRRVESLGALDDAGAAVRVHGDLHLGQVLVDGGGAWQLLDFEGEPARGLRERRRPSSPLRDVAGLLRSFDYAAAHDAPDRPPAPAVAAWRDAARTRLLDGYLTTREAAVLLPAGRGARRVLLEAFELDKAVYELGYELANRPAWAAIPVGGILRVLDRDGRPALERR